MRIFSRKAFGFRNPDKTISEADRLYRVAPLGFQDVPDWVGQDDLFKAAVDEGSIEVVKESPRVAVSDKKNNGKAEKAAVDEGKDQ